MHISAKILALSARLGWVCFCVWGMLHTVIGSGHRALYLFTIHSHTHVYTYIYTHIHYRYIHIYTGCMAHRLTHTHTTAANNHGPSREVASGRVLVQKAWVKVDSRAVEALDVGLGGWGWGGRRWGTE